MPGREALQDVESSNVLEDANNEEQTSDNENTTAGAEPEGIEEADGDEEGSENDDTNKETAEGSEKDRGDGSGNDEDEEDKEDNDDPVHIAEDILEIILKDMGQVFRKVTSLDSVILLELKETEDRAQVLAETLSKKKKEIKELREKTPIYFSDVGEIEAKQLEIQKIIEEFEELTAKMKELLDTCLHPSLLPEVLPLVCSLCNKESCICQKAEPVSGPEHICTCEEEVCKCYEPRSYTPGQWLEQQVLDLFPLQYEKPVCVCGSTSLVCVCKYKKKHVKECVCKKEDLKEFNMIVDVMPKVVVCAPDISLPRIIVCEPYLPKKPAPKKPHVCEKNRSCKLYKYPGF